MHTISSTVCKRRTSGYDVKLADINFVDISGLARVVEKRGTTVRTVFN